LSEVSGIKSRVMCKQICAEQFPTSRGFDTVAPKDTMRLRRIVRLGCQLRCTVKLRA
jgi:hypothetical protein